MKSFFVSAGLILLFSGCEFMNPFEQYAGHEYFPEKGDWIYQMYFRDPRYRWQFQRVFNQRTQMRYRLRSDKEVDLDVLEFFNRQVDASGGWYTYFYIDGSGVYQHSGYSFFPVLMFPLYAGRKWTVDHLLYDSNGPYDARLEASVELDTVTVPAGSFETFKVILNFYDYYEWEVNRNKKLWWRLVRWYAKDYGVVKEYDSWLPTTRELESFERW